MSVSVRKHASGGNYVIPTPGQEMTAREIWTVTWTGNPASAPEDGQIIRDAITAGLPYVGKRNTSCDPNIGMMVCQSLDWQKIPTCSTAWNVTVIWGTYANFLTNSESNDTEPFTRVTRIGSMRMTNMYRAGLTPPTPSSYAWPPATDIGGTKIDVNGQPSPFSVPQMQIQIEFMYDRTDTTSDQGAEPDNSLVEWLGVRNSQDFLGFSAGYVLCTGVSASPLNKQWYMMQFTYLYDYWGHYEQRSAPNLGGLNHLTTAASTFIGVPWKQANKVGWWQPYTDTHDLNDMFPDDVLAAITSVAPTGPFGSGCGAVPIRDTTGMQFDYPSFP